MTGAIGNTTGAVLTGPNGISASSASRATSQVAGSTTAGTLIRAATAASPAGTISPATSVVRTRDASSDLPISAGKAPGVTSAADRRASDETITADRSAAPISRIAHAVRSSSRATAAHASGVKTISD
jgi:hypothetical protein